jgi:hypothetical protein
MEVESLLIIKLRITGRAQRMYLKVISIRISLEYFIRKRPAIKSRIGEVR